MYLFAKDFRAMARERLRGFWAISVAVALVAALLGGGIVGNTFSAELNLETETVTQTLPPDATVEETLAYYEYVLTETLKLLLPVLIGAAVYGIAIFIIGGAVQVGYCRFLLDQFDRKEPKFSVLFSKFHMFGRCFLLHLLTGIFVFLWSLLLIVPGIIAAYRYSMAPFIMAEHPEMTPMECLRASKEMMMGQKGRLFCLNFSFIGWIILSAFTFGIGGLFLMPYMSAATAAFYRTLNPAANAAEDGPETAGFDPMNIMADHVMMEEVCQEDMQAEEHAIGGGNGGLFGD